MRKRQVDADVLALLREWKLEDEAERLAKNGVCKMKDLEFMKAGDVQKFGLRLTFRGLLQHVAKQKKRLSDGSKEKKAKPSPAAAPPNKEEKQNMPGKTCNTLNSSTQGDPSPVKTASDVGNERINLRVKGVNGEVLFKIKKQCLKKLMEAYCESQNLKMTDTVFLFAGKNLLETQSADELKMQDDDVVEAKRR